MRSFNKKWFTIFELSIGIVIFSTLMAAILTSLQYVSIARQKSENRIHLLEELYFFSEKLLDVIGDGGTLDYEEYWNRMSYNTATESGHYMLPSWVGNYWSGGILWTNTYWGWQYLCRSNGTRMGTGWCMIQWTLNSKGVSMSGTFQRYWQYALQYMDYNGNNDSDLGDEDENGNIVGDEDDRDIGDGPEVISWALSELYLINETEKTRTYLRFTVKSDPNAPAWTTCTFSWGEWTGCLGNIQILRMRGLDRGLSHSGTLTDTGAFDGVIDTWICHPDWKCSGPTIWPNEVIATGSWWEWVDLFPDSINVKNMSFVAKPSKNPWRAWSAEDKAVNPNFVTPFIHPYVKIKLTLWFSWAKRNLQIQKTDDPTISIVTTVNLSDL
jgi:hypothetical protein